MVHKQDDSFKAWSASAPEILRCMQEYEALTGAKPPVEHEKHHEDTPQHKLNFNADVKEVVDVMSGSFNPFAADSSTSSVLCYLHNG